MTTRDIDESGFAEEIGQQTEAVACIECSGELVTERGELHCDSCGLVVDEYRFDHGPDYSRFGDSAWDEERTGAPLTPARHDRGLSTEIGLRVDGKGRVLSRAKQRRLRRLRRQHTRGRWRSKSERNLAHGFGEIARIAGSLDVPRDIRERACMLYREASKENLILGRSIEAMAAGCLYAACRSESYLRTLDEIAEVAQCSRSSLRNAYRVLSIELGVEAPPPNIRDYVSRIASACDVSGDVRMCAFSLADIAEKAGLDNGRKPSGVAAACLYAAGKECGSGLTQCAIGEVSGVTEPTIRKRYYELLEVQSKSEMG